MIEERKRAPKRTEVRITYDKTTLFVGLGDGPAQISDGYGGWVTVERPKDEGITRWLNQPNLRMTLPLLVDNFGGARGVERDRDRILRLGRRGDGDRQPPIFRVAGAVPFSNARWVLEGVEMGDALYEDGHLARQFLTLTLLSYERPDTAKFGRRHGGSGGLYTPLYTVKEGDTLRKIAAKLKPDASPEERRDYARAIGKLNGIDDVRRELNVGRELRLP